MKAINTKLTMRTLFSILVLISSTTTHAYEVDCSEIAIRQRSQEMAIIRKEAQQSYNLKTIDNLIEKLDQLYAEERICLRANLSTIDGSNN